MLRFTLILLVVCSMIACQTTPAPAPEPAPAQVIAVESQETPASPASVTATLAEYLQRLERLGFSGSVLVAKDGEVLLHDAYGLADHQSGAPYTTRTVSTIGSVTKPFTAVTVMNLVDDGLLSTDDPLSKFFSEVPADKSAITIHQLLTHSAGFPGAIGDDLEKIGRDEYLRRAFDAPLRFEPGTAYDYSNVGYSILAAIIEKVTGQPYEVALRQRVLVPASMTDTGYQRAGLDPSRFARGVRDGEDWGTIAEKTWGDDGPGWHLVGNGGLVSTPADLYKLQQALHSGRILSDDSYRKMITPWVREGEDADSFYGYGWAIWLDDAGAPEVIAHNGGNGIFHTDVIYSPADELIVIGMSNVSDRSFIDISERVARLARGEEMTLPPAIVEVPASALQRMSGVWTTTAGGRMETRVEGKALVLRPLDPVALESISPVPNERARAILDDVSSQTRSIVAASMAGDYRPLQQALGGPPLEEITTHATETRAELERDKGTITDHEVVTSYVDRGMAAVLVRLDQERGESYLVYRWGPGGLRGIRVLESFPEVRFHPVGPGELASYDFRRGTRIGLSIEGDEMIVTREGGEQTAARRN